MPFEKWSTTDHVGKSALRLDKASICHSRDRATNQQPRSSVCWQFPEQNVDCRKKVEIEIAEKKRKVVYLHLTETHQLYVYLIPMKQMRAYINIEQSVKTEMLYAIDCRYILLHSSNFTLISV